MSEETKQDVKPMLSDSFIDFIKIELVPDMVKEYDDSKGIPAIKMEILLTVSKDGELTIANQELSTGIIAKKEEVLTEDPKEG